MMVGCAVSCYFGMGRNTGQPTAGRILDLFAEIFIVDELSRKGFSQFNPFLETTSLPSPPECFYCRTRFFLVSHVVWVGMRAVEKQRTVAADASLRPTLMATRVDTKQFRYRALSAGTEYHDQARLALVAKTLLEATQRLG
jgi:hypothetical protein